MKTLRQPQEKKNILIYFDLVTSLKTTQEVDNFRREIEDFTLAFFKSEKVSVKAALKSISEESAQKIVQTFSKNELDIEDKDTVVKFLETLKKLFKKFRIIKLTLAFDPSRKTIEKIHGYIVDTLGVGYILDIEVSPEILGGAIVMFEGKYKDFSLKKSIEDTFETKAEDIYKLFN